MQFNQIVLTKKSSAGQVNISTQEFMYITTGWLGALMTVLLVSLALRG